MSWEELAARTADPPDRIQGPTNSQSVLRLFGQAESSIEVTLFRDHHAWCPYCQKIWLWLEFKRIPYRIRKVTMRCYGPKERWFLDLVPSGMLPALALNNRLITESDVILEALEQRFGALGQPMNSPDSLALRGLERQLFRAWCLWLCTPNLNGNQQQQAKEQYRSIARRFEQALQQTSGPWLRGTHPETVDLVFVPYVERMNASLAYYKGYRLRREHPVIDQWLRALEELEVYRGTQSDFHTHAHDLPPQMGGCWSDNNSDAETIAARIDCGEGLAEDEASWININTDNDAAIALERVLRHRQQLLIRNPLGPKAFDQPLRSALTRMMTGLPCQPSKGTASALRYLRDRISVPRDMPLPAGRLLRQALESTAALDGDAQAESLPKQHRYDQDPRPFLNPS